MSTLKTVVEHCVACDGTGLYQGMCEPKGTAVVCIDCNGTGGHEIAYRPYGGRVLRKKASRLKIRLSRGRFLVGPIGADLDGPPMTYGEFLRRFPAKEAR